MPDEGTMELQLHVSVKWDDFLSAVARQCDMHEQTPSHRARHLPSVLCRACLVMIGCRAGFMVSKTAR